MSKGGLLPRRFRSVRSFVPGVELARAFYDEVVAPLLGAVPHAAALLGSGSEVLGFDTERSTDHGWGPRLQVFVAREDLDGVARLVEGRLPDEFRGWPARFGWDATPVSHHVCVAVLEDFLGQSLGFDPRAGSVSSTGWLRPSRSCSRSRAAVSSAIPRESFGRYARLSIGIPRTYGSGCSHASGAGSTKRSRSSGGRRRSGRGGLARDRGEARARSGSALLSARAPICALQQVARLRLPRARFVRGRGTAPARRARRDPVQTPGGCSRRSLRRGGRTAQRARSDHAPAAGYRSLPLASVYLDPAASSTHVWRAFATAGCAHFHSSARSTNSSIRQTCSANRPPSRRPVLSTTRTTRGLPPRSTAREEPRSCEGVSRGSHLLRQCTLSTVSPTWRRLCTI